MLSADKEVDQRRLKTTEVKPEVKDRAGVNSTPELDFLANSSSDSRTGIELELPSFEWELESELHSAELDSELPSMELKSDTKSLISLSTVGL